VSSENEHGTVAARGGGKPHVAQQLGAIDPETLGPSLNLPDDGVIDSEARH
jgi:hypothetical protein